MSIRMTLRRWRFELFPLQVNAHIGGITRAQAYYGGRNVARRARFYAPKDTGELMRSIRAGKVQGYLPLYHGVDVSATARHAYPQEVGTRGSVARPGRVLAFRPKGSAAVVFAQRTGPVPATRYMQRALDYYARELPLNFGSDRLSW